MATVVTVSSSSPPTIAWRCPTCRDRRVFRCSERFRVNTNGKLADIWLIYRCDRCDATKNITVIERTPVQRIDPALFAAATDNNSVVARHLSRDASLLARAGARLASGDAWELTLVRRTATEGRVCEFVLDFPEPLLVRLDRILAHVLGLPAREVAACVPDLGDQRLDRLRLWTTTTVMLTQPAVTSITTLPIARPSAT